MALQEIDLTNIEEAATNRRFAHYADTLLLVTEIKRLREEIK